MNQEVEDFLEHHGVLGMKWGKRRTKKEQKARDTRAKVSKNRRSLSDEDLKKHIERISLERKLKSLADEDLKPGRSVAKKIVTESGQKVAKVVVVGAATYGVKKALEAHPATKGISSFIPKPKK